MAYTLFPGRVPTIQYVICPDGKRAAVIHVKEGETRVEPPMFLPDRVQLEIDRRFRVLRKYSSDKHEEILKAFPPLRFPLQTFSVYPRHYQ